LEKPVILELDQEMSKPLRTFFTEIILRFIHLYRLSQGETDKLRHVLFLEEVHNLFPKSKYEQEANTSLEYVYREIRAFGQGLVSITQHPSLLPIYVLGNCHTQVYLSLQHERDVRAAREALFIKPEEENYLDRLKLGEGIVKVKGRINPCLVRFPLVPIIKGVIDDEYIRSRGLSALSGAKEPLKPQIKDFPEGGNNDTEAIKFLGDIYNEPFSTLAVRYKRLGLSMRRGNFLKHSLHTSGLIVPRRIITRKTQIVLADITMKGKALLRQAGFEIFDKSEGVEHRYWKERIAGFYREKGFNVIVEEPVNGYADIVVENKDKRIAVEIETGNSDALANIRKDIKAGFHTILSVSTNSDVLERIKRQVKDDYLDQDERIKLLLAQDFDI